jgi:hypothetical protein
MNNFECVDLVIRHAPKDLTAIQRLVLIQIAFHQPKSYQRVSTLAAEIGISQEETVRKAIKVLSERGLISVQYRKGHTSIYKVLVSNSTPVRQGYSGQTGGQSTHETGGESTRQTGVKQIKKQTILTKEDFESFWNLYPRKESRKRAEQAFNMLTPNVSIDALLTATRTYRDSVQDKDLQYVALACNWLEQERWLDQVAVSDDYVERMRAKHEQQ